LARLAQGGRHVQRPKRLQLHDMANPAHVALLRKGVREWNEWRNRNRYSYIDLKGADLSGTHLLDVDLRGAILTGADLSGADLDGANFMRAMVAAAQAAFIVTTRLDGANLRGATVTLPSQAIPNSATFRALAILSLRLSERGPPEASDAMPHHGSNETNWLVISPDTKAKLTAVVRCNRKHWIAAGVTIRCGFSLTNGGAIRNGAVEEQ
jgi:hypothetical protein